MIESGGGRGPAARARARDWIPRFFLGFRRGDLGPCLWTWTPPDTAVRVVVENGQVSVTDHGPGIADNDLPHIFERFYRAPVARGMPGAGLGLAIVGGVAQANNGRVVVQTGPHGSTFTLAFRPLPSAVEIVTGQQE